MPHIPLVVSDGVHKHALRVLITGFGPFANYKENPSWLAVRELNNVLLEPSSLAQPVTLEHQQVYSDEDSRPIHVTTLMVPVTYSAVLSTVPNLHARPPNLPIPPGDDIDKPLSTDPPPDGYDLIIHVGAGRTGNLRIEKLGHKYGYDMPDVDSKFAPEVQVLNGGDAEERDEAKRAGGTEDAAEVFERARVAAEKKSSSLRGFAEGYEPFDEELKTDVDVDKLVEDLKHLGVDQIEASTNAGRYLCDFIYYCSLAEAQRTREAQSSSGKATKVLFVHCPPVDKPLNSEYVTEALKCITMSVCGRSS
ncbi:peptidase C15, pyroglutamyl peptidase I-like protein [Fomitiporia mediterranea MF3/22]|uniref:peptidase C15, pyroglutamyl peptidase I-like protein n=1 Tax=Fomitiporia mediterranea (strain MF3/22) TaxID=694068 RepID=UPI0004408B23|nr:peptidase C15, pyroglutamyl peptidase I-like protein [Fomitiporia mediterranea MF3/22]EJD02569.1 peptidase C15, pyroglutamyl peptidase I-like protein [Fomitiporia mediterranea MF3/22]